MLGRMDPKVLGQLSVMQSVLASLPDEKSIFSFVKQGLLEVPGISAVQLVETPRNGSGDEEIVFAFGARNDREALLLTISDRERFALYQDYISNFCFMVGVIIEERRLRRQNEQQSLELKKSVEARTRELQEKEERLRVVIEGSKVGLFDYFPQTGKMIISDTARKHFGMPVDRDVTYEVLLQYIYPEDRERMDRLSRAAMSPESGGRYENEYRTMHPTDGSIHWLYIRGQVYFDLKGAPVRFVAVSLDITERKNWESELIQAKESAEHASLLKSRFLDIAAHELRTPVTASKLQVQLLIKQLEAGRGVDPFIVERLLRQTDRLARLVLDLLDVSRLERGKVPLNPVRTDLVPVIQDCIHDFRIQAPNRKIEYRGPESAWIEVDSLRINQVLSNLIDNAIKYTPQETAIEVSLIIGASIVRVCVIDHGPGIDRKRQADLFKAFVRGKAEEVAQTHGLGLGLYVCNMIIALHGGKMGVESEPGRGSLFYFELPLKS